jgi:hypothetical protein
VTILEKGDREKYHGKEKVVGIEVKLPRESPKGLSLFYATHSQQRKHLNYSGGRIRSSFCRLLMGSIM